MRSSIPTAMCAIALAPAGPAGAETWSILQGAITDGTTGVAAPLTGAFEGERFESSAPEATDRLTISVDDFAFQAGERSLQPRPPIEYDGLRPLFDVQIADHLQVEGRRVGLVLFRSGGDLVEEDGDEVSFRYVELRSAATGGGRTAGLLEDGVMPRRLHLEGTVVEVDKRYRIARDECLLQLQPPPRTPPDGGVAISHTQFTQLDLLALDTAVFRPPVGGDVHIARVTRLGGQTIDGSLRTDGTRIFVNPSPIDLGPIASTGLPPAPSLEELGITAPDGAEVTLDEGGVLSVTSEGDLYFEASFPEIPGLTSVRISTTGSVFVTADLGLPPELHIYIDAGERVEIGVPIGGEPPDLEPLPPIVRPRCDGLRQLGPADERQVGTFSLVATAAQPAQVDVSPWSRHNRIQLGSRKLLPVVLLGSDDLDVRDVDPRSLRLGAGEARPRSHRGRPWVVRWDLNRDGHRDLLAFFYLRHTETAYGDRELCLLAQTREATLLEGCDAVDTVPKWERRRRAQRLIRSRRTRPSR